MCSDIVRCCVAVGSCTVWMDSVNCSGGCWQGTAEVYGLRGTAWSDGACVIRRRVVGWSVGKEGSGRGLSRGRGWGKPRKSLLRADGHRNGDRTANLANTKQGCYAPGDIFLPLGCAGGTKEQAKDTNFVVTIMVSSSVLRIDMYSTCWQHRVQLSAQSWATDF